MKRRTLVTTALIAAALAPLGTAQAQAAFPSKPVTIIVPNAPGGAIDIMARLLEKHLAEAWKQPVVVQYKPGANTMLGTDFVAKSAPDGHTIGLVVTSHVINPGLRAGKMPFDTLKDLSGVTMLATSPVLISATPQLPANNIKELIALAKKDPGKLTYASPGAGSSMHLGTELLKSQAGIDIVHAPYKGAGGAFPDVFAGRVELIVDPLFSSWPHVKAGKLKPIAIMSPQRSAIAPDVPTVAEALPGFSVQSIFGAVVPSATPREVVKRINADMVKALQTPELKQRMADVALTPVGNTPEQFDAFIKSEIVKWEAVAKKGNITAE